MFRFINKLLSFLRPVPSPQTIAKQLRQPKGKLGEVVARKMNESNSFLYDFVIDAMHLQDNQSVLEIGFGNGKFFDKLFVKANNLKVSGIDFSEDMFMAAEKNNQEAIDNDTLDLQFGDCEVLPFNDKTFDKVFCINVVYFWENPMDNLMEIHRVLKPGGKFYTGIRHKDAMKYWPFTKFGFNMYDEESWKQVLLNNFFHFEKVLTIDEPPLEYNGETYTPKAMCFVAQKPVY